MLYPLSYGRNVRSKSVAGPRSLTITGTEQSPLGPEYHNPADRQAPQSSLWGIPLRKRCRTLMSRRQRKFSTPGNFAVPQSV